MMIHHATLKGSNVTCYFKARACNGKMDLGLTAYVLSLMPLLRLRAETSARADEAA